MYSAIHLGISDPSSFQRVHWVQLKFGLEIIIIAHEKHFATNELSALRKAEAGPKLFGQDLNSLGCF